MQRNLYDSLQFRLSALHQPLVLHDSLESFLLAVDMQYIFCISIYNRMQDTLTEPRQLILSLWTPLQYRAIWDQLVNYCYRLQVDYPGLFLPYMDGIIRFRLLLPKSRGDRFTFLNLSMVYHLLIFYM